MENPGGGPPAAEAPGCRLRESSCGESMKPAPPPRSCFGGFRRSFPIAEPDAESRCFCFVFLGRTQPPLSRSGTPPKSAICTISFIVEITWKSDSELAEDRCVCVFVSVCLDDW